MLDTRYTGFGEAVSGAEAIVAIEQTPLEDPNRPPTDPRAGRPANPPRIVSAELIDAPPFGTGPEPVKRPTDPDAGTR
jgi:cyclophilin family peptidyl-prolyl cis-trans isomerase